jgi:hypothetical protein
MLRPVPGNIIADGALRARVEIEARDLARVCTEQPDRCWYLGVGLYSVPSFPHFATICCASLNCAEVPWNL